MLIFIWVVALLFLGLWSLAGWGLVRLLAMDGSWVAAIEPLLHKMPFGDLLERWLPTWQDMLRLLLDMLQSALAWVGTAAPVVVTVVWALGAALLLLCAGLLTLLVVLMRRHETPAPASAVA